MRRVPGLEDKYSILVNLGVPIELEIGSEAVELEDEVNSFFFYYY